jgi:hypothetical protein
VTFETLGSYPELGLAAAREKARETLGILAQGKTRRELEAEKRRDQEQARLAERERHESTFAGVAEAFIGDHLPRIKTRQRAERLIRRLV